MTARQDPPRDATLALLADPYRFISKQCERIGADGFETHVLLKDTICLRGPEAAALFYDVDRFKRDGAMPSPIRKTLLGEGGVQGLDGDAHRHRKQMFMALMAPERVAALGDLVRAEWLQTAERWASAKTAFRLYDELHPMLTRSVCAWAGVPLQDAELETRAGQLRALFDAAGSRSLRHLWSRQARRQVDRWLAGIVEAVREGRLDPGEQTAAHRIALARDLEGSLLPPRVAAVELANVLRPTVATAVYIVFVAHALRAYPERAAACLSSADGRRAFVQEVRRYYPFFPAVIARARRPFTWRGLEFPPERQTILDLYGTNHDPGVWGDPEAFRPQRFLERTPGPFEFLPQGGGDHHLGHRCPGEWIVVELMERSLQVLAEDIDYDVPDQDLSIDFRRLPALPRSGFVMTNVRRKT
ncbi:MAG: cytochrome P450 [Caulobacter sp.]|nr:cytochrome P450 [Caulobacter sp.]